MSSTHGFLLEALAVTVRSMTIGEQFGRNLKQWREARGLSQPQLAERVSLSANYIRVLESKAHREPSLDAAVRIARELGVSVDTLAGVKSPSWDIEELLKDPLVSFAAMNQGKLSERQKRAMIDFALAHITEADLEPIEEDYGIR